MASRGKGRPTKLTPALQEKICQYIRLGMKYERAAIAAGISESTFYSWKEKGEQQKTGSYRDFLEALKKAEVTGEARLLAKIEQHGSDDKPGKWQALAWILERRHRSTYGPPKVVEEERTQEELTPKDLGDFDPFDPE